MTETQAREEIEALHQFFVEWFGGSLADENEVFESRFAARFHPDCVLIQPSGASLTLAQFLNVVRTSHGSSPDFRIAIRNVKVRYLLPDGYALVCYEEWQRNAVNSKPTDNARSATVLFQQATTHGAPLWLHIHETWLPATETPPSRFDF